MSDKDNDKTSYIEELESRIEVLENENAQLAERGEDTLLLGVISEHINKVENIDEILIAGLEKISILKNIEFAACCVLEREHFLIKKHFFLLSNDELLNNKLALTEETRNKLARQKTILLQSNSEQRCPVLEFENTLFSPLQFLIIPYMSLLRGLEMFCFGVMNDEDELSHVTPLLKRVVEMIINRLDTLSLMGDMKELNRNLDQKVLEKTKELIIANDELKNSEKKYLKQSAEFQAIFNSITDAIVFVDLERRILMVNPAFTSILGYELEEVKGKKSKVIYANPNDFQQKGKERFHEGAKIINPVYEVDYRRKDGSVFTGETLGIQVKDYEQNIVGYLGIIRDITERKKAEEEKAYLEKQLRQAYKMEAIGTMAGGIAHDFNNILAIILGNADMAKDDIPEGNPAKYNTEQVIIAANRAKDLVRQILTFSRESEQELLPIQPFPVIKESLKLIRSTTPTSVNIEQKICTEDCKIMADATQFHQLLMNLFSNAVYAMDEKGQLSVTVEVTDLDLIQVKSYPGLRPGKHLKITVSDTGIGMDKETLDRIFDPFFTTKDVDEGTGMGLSIVLGIIKSHKGYIKVDSTPEKGTTFSLYFPTIEEIQTQNLVEESGGLPTGSERILFVDDELMLAEMGKRMLERSGYQVTTKTNSQEALDTFKLAPDAFDLVITDQSMPNMTGSELAVELIKVNCNIPIILCTGFSKKISEETAKEIGIRDFCLKPLDRKSLSQLVRKVLDEV